MRSLLEAEARALTDVGNGYQIRHFELGKHPIERSEHIDYPFHRMAAMMQLILASRRSGAGAT